MFVNRENTHISAWNIKMFTNIWSTCVLFVDGRRAPVQLQNILKFVTGSEVEPRFGYAIEPSIEFDADIQLPYANTCIKSSSFTNDDYAYEFETRWFVIHEWLFWHYIASCKNRFTKWFFMNNDYCKKRVPHWSVEPARRYMFSGWTMIFLY